MKVLITDTVTGKNQEFSTISSMDWWIRHSEDGCFMGKLFGLKLPCGKTNRFKVKEITNGPRP